MDQAELQKNIALYYSKLPPAAQAAFSSMAWLENLKSLSDKYGFTEEQKQNLGTETTLVLLGMIHLDEYETTLRQELGLTREVNNEIISEIESTIIRPIRGDLENAYDKNIQTEEGGAGEPEIVSDIDKRFLKLPPDIQKVIVESNYQSNLYAVAKEHNLTIAEMGMLEKLTVDLIIGEIHPDQFEDRVQGRLALEPEKTRALVNAMNEKVFKKIRENLMGLSKTGVEAESNTKETLAQINIPPRISVDEHEVLSEHGIDILHGPLELSTTKKEVPHPIMAQKLSAPFQIPAAKSEYIIEKAPEIEKPAPTAPVIITPPVAPKPKITAYPPKADPYRVNPEEDLP